LEPRQGHCPWNHSFWLGNGRGPTVPYQGRCRPSPIPQPMDRLPRASPFAGGPGGNAFWWVQGRSPWHFVGSSDCPTKIRRRNIPAAGGGNRLGSRTGLKGRQICAPPISPAWPGEAIPADTMPSQTCASSSDLANKFKDCRRRGAGAGLKKVERCGLRRDAANGWFLGVLRSRRVLGEIASPAAPHIVEFTQQYLLQCLVRQHPPDRVGAAHKRVASTGPPAASLPQTPLPASQKTHARPARATPAHCPPRSAPSHPR
jgi:hypothetical protein